MRVVCTRSGCVAEPETFETINGQEYGWCSIHIPAQPSRIRSQHKTKVKKIKSKVAVVTQCVWCGCDLNEETMTREHVIPKHRGGTLGGNMAPACNSCNTEKAGMDAREYLEYLREKRTDGL